MDKEKITLEVDADALIALIREAVRKELEMVLVEMTPLNRVVDSLEEKELLTEMQAAQLIGLCPDEIQELGDTGMADYTAIGRQRFYHRESLINYINSL